MFRLDNKIAVITGAGSGIGRSIATTFGTQGAHVIALDINADAANETAKLIQTAGGSAEAQTCDVTRADAVEQCFKTAFAKHKTLDILVTSAGVSHVGNVEHRRRQSSRWCST